jgi:tRNA 5-methylaminomethyl-2-thiouridine biosynthesis bifunctional protein
MSNSPDGLDWTEDGAPRSRRYGDVYFSAEDGLAESRAVFLDGCGLPDAWATRRRFTVAELGFGTGLNIVALLDLWRRTAPPDSVLSIVSVEAHPMSATESARALARWPELTEAASPLLARWPGRARGWHRVDLPGFRAILDVAVMDVAEALSGWRGRADAWLLDGFAPSANPAMWSEAVLNLVGARSAPGARAATFTVAGAVRRGLAAAGFIVEKRPGFGRKRERLEARMPGVSPESPSPRRVAIIGGGVAGAAAARAVRALGAQAIVVEAEAPGHGGSGNPAALVTPRLDAGLGAPAAFYAQAFARAVRLYEQSPAAVIARGVIQLAANARDPGRFARLAGSDLFEPETMLLLGEEAVAARLGAAAVVSGALDQTQALVVRPREILDAWLGAVRIARLDRLERDIEGWRLLDGERALILIADAVILAGALDARRLIEGLPLSPVRGQASWTTGGETTLAAAWGGYAVPTDSGVLFGATHDRDDATTEVREIDHARNRLTLAAGLPSMPDRIASSPLEGRAAVRAVTPDRLPLAGPIGPPGLYVLSGFGSRGFTFAPLLAEHVAAEILGAPSPLPAAAAAMVSPSRFIKR